MVPVIGDPQQWAIGDAPMQAPAWRREVIPDADPNASQDSQVGRRAVFHVHAQADVLGARDATAFIENVASKWEHGGEKFTRDLAHPRSEFPWGCYLASTEWGKAIHVAGVASFWLVWVGGEYSRGGFYVKYGQPRIERVIFPDRGGGPDEKPVSSICWHV